MQLFRFQQDAASQIAERFKAYSANRLWVDERRRVPYYQNLIAITGAGKTAILAESLAQLRAHLHVNPIVLWLSKGKVVVLQTYAALSSGGAYADILADYTVRPLLDCAPADIKDAGRGLLLVATAAKFNVKDKSQGDRTIYRLGLDVADKSLWDQLADRFDSNSIRRPLIVVYDEGHNLTDQQIVRLLELEPDALIAASATMRIPRELERIIERFRDDKRWTEADLQTVVPSREVVESGLVKERLSLGGYVAPMEETIDELLATMSGLEQSATALSLPFKPKAIYVTDTNIVRATGAPDDIHRPFKQREARPILIWRHLVDRGVNPATIAVYCNLKQDAAYPFPLEFKLFAGGDSDYDNFIAGDYQHIIFNLTLQEGWDEPTCYLAYIDKDMGSTVQVTQVVGRVLRQPSARHYPSPGLNTAHFFVRTDEKQVFEDVLSEVQQEIEAENPTLHVSVYSGGSGSAAKQQLEPKGVYFLPEVVIDSARAHAEIGAIVETMNDYRHDDTNTVGQGSRMKVLQKVAAKESQKVEWTETQHTNRMTARSIFLAELKKTYPQAANLCDTELPKFDALVEYTSRAAVHIRERAALVAQAFVKYSIIVHSWINPIPVPEVPVDPIALERFNNAVHPGYSGMNKLEKQFARALDKTKRVWMRNQSRGLFAIPLLQPTGQTTFNPDFIVWHGKHLYTIDTKGKHLLNDDADRKLLEIPKAAGGRRLFIRFVAEGEWNDKREQLNEKGFTVWWLKNGKISPTHVRTAVDAVRLALTPDD